MTDLVLLSRDGMFLKDGREWATSDAGRAHSLGWPAPSTLLGALCTASGRAREAAGNVLTPQDWQSLAAAITLGPSIALRGPLGAAASGWTHSHRVWSVPADALFLADAAGAMQRVLRLDPRPPRQATLGRDEDPAREALWWPHVEDPAKPARAPLWWPEEAIVEWLADPVDVRPCNHAYRGLALPRHIETHVGIDPATFAARESILFTHDVVESLDSDRCEWAIGCRVSLPGKIPARATLGGDRRLARITPAGAGLFGPPPALIASFAARPPKGLRLVAVTPAAFAAGWRPDGFSPAPDNTIRGHLPGLDAELILRAAFVPRAAHVSGWDMAKGKPKPTTRLVPPGAVYHFVRADGQAFPAAMAETLWLVVLGNRTAHGFGCFVPGAWHPQETAA